MDELTDTSLIGVTPDELAGLAVAAREVRTCRKVLAKTGDTVLTELMRGQGTVQEWRHYPQGDVYDAEFHAQYYYHCHPSDERRPGEHGHFHTFLRPFGMPPGMHPAEVPGFRAPLGDNDALSHLVGISVSATGEVTRLFTTNRWVTGETWYAADDVVAMLDCFTVDHARPSWPLNRWITGILRLFRPRIAELLRDRDAVVERWRRDNPGRDVFEDRALEVPSEIVVDADAMILAVERAMRAARRGSSSDRESSDAA